MSGHSHWSTIKHKKETEDKKKGKIFSKLAREILVAAKDGGDPERNYKLKQAVEEAKKYDMPKENIERAIKKGTGEIEGEALEEVRYEGIGPEKTAIIIEGITDNKNRTRHELSQILQKNGGKLAQPNAMLPLFEKKGVISAPIPENKNKEEIELEVIELGAEDIHWDKENQHLNIYTKPEELAKVKEKLENQGLSINSFELIWIPKKYNEISKGTKEKLFSLFETLSENDAVQDIYSNIKS